MIQSGDLRHRIDFQERNEPKGAQGGITPSWTTVASRWAEIVPLAGKELIQAQQIKATISHLIRLRYYPDLTAKLRIVFKERVFGIENVRNIDERNIEHVCLCTEGE